MYELMGVPAGLVFKYDSFGPTHLFGITLVIRTGILEKGLFNENKFFGITLQMKAIRPK